MKWLLLITCLAASVLVAQEFRTFTDAKGRTMEARVLRVAGSKCQIERKDGRRFVVEIATFSEVDQDYLFKFAAGALPPGGVPDVAMPEAAPLDENAEPPLNFPGVAFDTKDTDHFTIHNSSKKFEPAQKHAEKAWEHMNGVLPTLRMDFEKMHFAAPNKSRNPGDFSSEDQRFRYRIYFPNPGEFAEMVRQYGATMKGPRQARFLTLTPQIGNFDDIDNRWITIMKQPGRPDMSYQNLLVHKLAASLTAGQARRQGLPLWLNAGIGYWLENKMFERCQVHYLDFQQYYAEEEGEVSKSETLDGSSTWTKPIRTLCRKGKTHSISDVVGAEPSNMSPELSGYVFAFTSFLVSNDDLRKKFHAMVLNQRDSPTRMGSTEVAESMGFESVEKMEEAWYKYILSNEFR